MERAVRRIIAARATNNPAMSAIRLRPSPHARSPDSGRYSVPGRGRRAAQSPRARALRHCTRRLGAAGGGALAARMAWGLECGRRPGSGNSGLLRRAVSSAGSAHGAAHVPSGCGSQCRWPQLSQLKIAKPEGWSKRRGIDVTCRSGCWPQRPQAGGFGCSSEPSIAIAEQTMSPSRRRCLSNFRQNL